MTTRSGASHGPPLLPGRTGLRWLFRRAVTLAHQLANPRDDLETQVHRKVSLPEHKRRKEVMALNTTNSPELVENINLQTNSSRKEILDQKRLITCVLL